MDADRRRPPRQALAAAAVVVVVAAVALVWLLRSGDGPSSTVEAYFDSKSEHDCAYLDLLSEERTQATDQGACEADPEAYFRDVVAPEGACEDLDLELSNEEEDGDAATVDYVVTSDDPACEDEGTVYLAREDGEWKVDHL